MFRAIGPSGPESQAFPVRGSHFNRRLRALTAAGAGEIIPASFRRGGAIWAVSCGVPGEIVKAMGDWRSTAYSCYVNQMPQKVTDHYRNLFARKLPYTMRTWVDSVKGKITILVVRIRMATWLHPNKKWLSVSCWCNGIKDARFVLAQFINGFNGMGMSVWLPDMDRMRERASGRRVSEGRCHTPSIDFRHSEQLISGKHLQIRPYLFYFIFYCPQH